MHGCWLVDTTSYISWIWFKDSSTFCREQENKNLIYEMNLKLLLGSKETNNFATKVPSAEISLCTPEPTGTTIYFKEYCYQINIFLIKNYVFNKLKIHTRLHKFKLSTF